MYEELTDDGSIVSYPSDAPYVLRDQGLRAADELVWVVISDARDTLSELVERYALPSEELRSALSRADALLIEAGECWADVVDGWADAPDDEHGNSAGERLQWILEECEALPFVRIDWNGEAGTVLITASDLWEDDYVTLRDMQQGYSECMVWANCYVDDPETGELQPLEYGSGDNSSEAREYVEMLTPETREVLDSDCLAFLGAELEDCLKYLESRTASDFGHDFALTRNGHGAGFWDRGLGELGERLSRAARVYGESHLWMDESGAIHAEG